VRPLTPAIDALSQVLLGKEHQIRLALTCLVARSHLLLEDLPGVGKTTLAETWPAASGWPFAGCTSPATWCPPI
jgi:MoxR-like ATPase